MNRSLRHPFVTHVLAGLVGLGMVWLGGRAEMSPKSGDASEAPQRTSSGRPLPTVGQSLSSEGFRQVIEHLSRRDLTTNERRDAMSLLFEEWVQRDPEGVLRFLDQVPHWPPDLKWDSWAAGLAKSRPDMLLDLALRHGLSNALMELEASGDPATVARLIENLPNGCKGRQVRTLLANVHREMGLAGIPMAVATPALLEGEAQAALREGDLDGFLASFEAIETFFIRSELITDLGLQLARELPSDEWLALVLRLPPGFRDAAAKRLDFPHLERPETRVALRAWIAKLVDHGMLDTAAEKANCLFSENGGQVQREIPDWLMTLPNDERWNPVSEAVIGRWYRGDHQAMVRGLAAMPAGDRRDGLAILALGMKGGGDSLQPEDAARVLALIADPELKEDWQSRLEEAEADKSDVEGQ
jgi:hypothetical protein